jgi:integrase
MARTPKEPSHNQQPQESAPHQQPRQAHKRPRKHRRHGEGSIYQLKDGRYAAALRVEGKRKVYYGKTYKEAQEKLQQALYEKKQGMLATGPQQTLEQFLSHWIEHVQKPAVGLKTYVNHRGLLYNHVIPVLGKVRLQQVTPEKLEMLYALLQQEKNLKASSIKIIHSILGKAFGHAVRRKIISHNPCDLAVKPRVEKFDIQPLNEEQAKRLVEAVRGDLLFEGLITVTVTLGLRRGEVLGLKWDDIDFVNKCLYVRRSTSRVGKYGIVEKEPKTKSGLRKISLPDFLIDILKRHQERQQEHKAKVGTTWKDSGYVFCNSVGNFYHESNLTVRYKRLLQRAGLPEIRFHDLRHSAATILLSMGVNPKVVQELLGHSSFVTTMNTYAHVLPSMQQEAVQKLDNFYQRSDDKS